MPYNHCIHTLIFDANSVFVIYQDSAIGSNESVYCKYYACVSHF